MKLGGLKVENVVTKEVFDLKVSGLFFAIAHEPTRFDCCVPSIVAFLFQFSVPFHKFQGFVCEI